MIFQKLLEKLIKKAVKKAVNANKDVEVPEMEAMVPEVEPVGDSKKALWKFLLQTLISILTAILTALGATSCVSHL